MALRFTYDAITGDRTPHTARRRPGREDAWEVSWLPGQSLDRTRAVTAMALAETNGARTPQPGDRYWPHLETWANSLGLTATNAFTQISQSPGRNSEKHGDTQADPEAAGLMNPDPEHELRRPRTPAGHRPGPVPAADRRGHRRR